MAVAGATIREGSVGRVAMDSIIAAGFEGGVWPINPKYREIAGRRCYRRAEELPGAPDLGVIVTPSATVPCDVSQLCDRGTRAAVVITAGLTRENGLRQAMLDRSTRPKRREVRKQGNRFLLGPDDRHGNPALLDITNVANFLPFRHRWSD